MNSPLHPHPPLPLDAVRQIDHICDCFEEALQSGDRPPIEVLLDAVDSPCRAPLLQALLDVELEYRRVWGERPCVQQYLERFPEHREAVRAVFEGADDPPNAPAGDLCLLQMALSKASGRRADRLRIYYRGQLVHTTLLSGPLEIGRQRQGEAPPFAVTTGEQGDRLIVAPLEETSVSRHHAYVAPEGENRIRITNLSHVNPILFPNGRRLHTDQSESFPLTIEMTLGAVFLRIDQPPTATDDSSSGSILLDAGDAPNGAEAQRGLLNRLWNRAR